MVKLGGFYRLLAPVSRLSKREIVWLSRHFCSHSHSYLVHYNCYLSEDNSKKEKVGFFDIETSGLQADFGVMICYAIKTEGKDEILTDCVTPEDLKVVLDKTLVKNCIRDLSSYDKVITQYGTGFDLPFVRSRAVIHRVPFPAYGEIVHKDVYYILRGKFKLHRNRLETACKELLGQTRKIPIDTMHWNKALLQGDPVSLKFIQDHCRKDVLDLEDLYHLIQSFTGESRRSI
jgi:uncharacterized protein YprB with RNaseH-like and TPR domain